MGLRLGTMTLLASASLLAGCGGAFQAQRIFDEANSVTPQGDAYHQALYAGYMEHATYEHELMLDYPDAVHHSNKALMAARNETPQPTEIGERRLPADKVDELTQARARLVAALGAGGAQKDPESAGKAQAYFDCWMEQQEENFQPKDIAYCRDGFFANLAQIETRAAGPVPEVTTLSTDVLFDFDRATIREEFKPDLDQIAQMMVQDTSTSVLVWGHADRSGPTAYNQRLSERRARAVADYLASQGVTRNRMAVQGFGETRPAVPTADGVREPRNRRVEIRRR